MGSKRGSDDGDTTIALNRRARYDYELLDRYEAGLALTGTEVKSLRSGKASLAQAWVKIDESGEAWLVQAHIPEYQYGNRENHEPTRQRKLLLKGHELDQLWKAVNQKGRTLVPTRLYWRNGYAKVEVAVARGKAEHDKRASIKEREAKRDAARAMRDFQRR
jgi:SsrA-binding protein